MNQTVSFSQLKALTFVSMLSPFLRLVPSAVTRQAGSAAWVSAALAIIPTFLLCLLFRNLLKHTPQHGLADCVLENLGKFPGSLVLSLWTLWLLFHSGFLLLSGADRFCATIFPNTSPTVFAAVTVVLCTIAASGSVKPIARLSELFRTMVLAVILLVLVFSLEEVEPTFLLPVIPSQTPDILKGVPLAAEAVSVAFVNAAFLHHHMSTDRTNPSFLPFLLRITVLNVLFCAVCVGSLGKTYTASVPYPFFILARDLSIISGVERIEALVVALWFLPDFVLITVELMIASENLCLISGHSREQVSWKALLPAASASVLFAILLPTDSRDLLRWSEVLIPFFHLSWAYLAVPLLLLISLLRRKF